MSSTDAEFGKLQVFEMAESTPCWQAHWTAACCLPVRSAVTTNSSEMASGTDESESTLILSDARTAEVLGAPNFDEGFMSVMYRLHVDLYAGLAGKLFLGFMGLLLMVAIVSGVVLYAPFLLFV